jgi:hypothetical protein
MCLIGAAVVAFVTIAVVSSNGRLWAAGAVGYAVLCSFGALVIERNWLTKLVTTADHLVLSPEVVPYSTLRLLPRLALALVLLGAFSVVCSAAIGDSNLGFLWVGQMLGFSVVRLARTELARSWERGNQKVLLARLRPGLRARGDYFVWPQ